mmetsp:Transcript_107197/g.320593  ORF Transcript_107197/g.320593 Transcript_107197/m.320593 type:complete len:318 (-) Transcript_107197:101-1054(-)
MLLRDEVLCVGDRHRRWVVLEWMAIERQRVQDATKHPDVNLLADEVALPEVQLDVCHFRWPVQHRHGLVDLLLQVQQRGSGQVLRGHALGAARAKIAELPCPVAAPQDVLHLQVTVLDGWPLGVKMADRIDYLHKRLHHFARRKVATLAVHEVEEMATTAKLHQELHSAPTSRVLVGRVTQALHDVWVRRKTAKYLCLPLGSLEAAGHLHALLTDNLLQRIRLARPGVSDLHDLAKCTLGEWSDLVDSAGAFTPWVLEGMRCTKMSAQVLLDRRPHCFCTRADYVGAALEGSGSQVSSRCSRRAKPSRGLSQKIAAP